MTTGLAMYIRIREIPVVNAVLRQYDYEAVEKGEDRYLGNIISSRHIKSYTVQQALINAVRQHRAGKSKL